MSGGTVNINNDDVFGFWFCELCATKHAAAFFKARDQNYGCTACVGTRPCFLID
jgi:hypothetical protein